MVKRATFPTRHASSLVLHDRMVVIQQVSTIEGATARMGLSKPGA